MTAAALMAAYALSVSLHLALHGANSCMGASSCQRPSCAALRAEIVPLIQELQKDKKEAVSDHQLLV